MNKAIIIGRLPRDPELKWIDKDNCVMRFQLVTNEKWNDKNGEKKERADFHTFSIWGKRAEVIHKWAKKGDLMSVEGRLRNNNYETKDGAKVYGYEIVVDNFEFLTSKKDRTDLPPSDTQTSSENNQQNQNDDNYEPPTIPANPVGKSNADDIPF